MNADQLVEQLQQRTQQQQLLAQQHQLLSNELLRLEGELRVLQQLHAAALAEQTAGVDQTDERRDAPTGEVRVQSITDLADDQTPF